MGYLDDMASWPSPLLDENAVPLVTLAWAPTLRTIAAKVPAYTVEGLEQPEGDVDPGDDGSYLTFTDGTDPSARQVAMTIASSIEHIVGEIDVAPAPTSSRYTTDPTGLNRWPALARACVAAHVAMTIEGDKRPAMTDDADGAYRSLRDDFNGAYKKLEEAVSRGGTRLA